MMRVSKILRLRFLIPAAPCHIIISHQSAHTLIPLLCRLRLFRRRHTTLLHDYAAICRFFSPFHIIAAATLLIFFFRHTITYIRVFAMLSFSCRYAFYVYAYAALRRLSMRFDFIYAIILFQRLF